MSYSDYIIYVDESGDHGLINIDPEYPVFCLAFCVIKKDDYINKIIPALHQLKFKYWGHDNVNLHASDIRKQTGNFAFLRSSPETREEFYQNLNNAIEAAPMKIIASVIDKYALVKRYAKPFNPYEISMLFCLEQIVDFLIRQGEKEKIVHVIFEGRGKKEDNDLELEFRRICDNQGSWGYKAIDFRVVNFQSFFVNKNCNLSGLQLSDLVARPIALKTIRPEQDNRAYEIIKDKIIARKNFP